MTERVSVLVRLVLSSHHTVFVHDCGCLVGANVLFCYVLLCMFFFVFCFYSLYLNYLTLFLINVT